MRFAITGAGMSGILSAIRLREAGLDDFAIYEKGDRVGGTWRQNTYPGLSCDVPSHLYSYSFEPNPNWSHHFSPGAEIEAYFEGVARKYGVEKRIRFGDEVVRLEFRDGRWHLETASGFRDEADFVIAATGVLHHPLIPYFPGLESFRGPTFHSARWDHDVSLEGKRVGIIGTGSTAVQIVSAIVDRVETLSLFQRTAQWIMPQANPAYSEEEKDGFRRHPEAVRQLHRDLSRLFAEGFSNAVVDADSPQMKMIADTCLANLEDNVADPELREKLRPDYQAACKRLVTSPDFYQAIQKPNATGFQVDRFLRPIEVIGRDGKRLDEVWSERPVAYLSISIPGLPNLFMLNGPNGPVGNFSLIEVAELQFAYIRQLIDLVRSGPRREVSADAEATARFDSDRVEAAKKTIWMTGCRSWYLDDRGIPATWPWTFDRFREEMAGAQLDDYELVA